MATLKLYLDHRSPKQDGSCALRLSVNHRGTTAFINIFVSVLPSQWDNVRSRVKNRTDKDSLNSYLSERLTHYSRLLQSVIMSPDFRPDISAKQLKDKILALETPETAEPVTLRSRWDKYLSRIENSRTREIYETTWKRICEFEPDADSLPMASVTRDWLQQFFSSMAQRSPSVNARNIHLRNIRAVFNDALDDEAITCYPFRKFKIRGVETAKRDLSLSELRSLAAMEVEPWQRRYLDCFMLSFCLLGINLGDLLTLPADCIHSGRIEYNRRKTKRLYSILVPPEAMEIINRYRGTRLLLSWCEGMKDYRYFAARMNRCLHELHPCLTSYWARHTWATLAYKLGISKDTISLALGHANGSRVTSIYINADLSAVDKANRIVLDTVFGQKQSLNNPQTIPK